MPPLQADEQFPFPAVALLWAGGLDVRTAAQAGLLRTPDFAVLAAATADGRAVLTFDRDYVVLHKRGVAHAGIVRATADTDFAGLATRILAALAGETDLTNRLLRIYKPNAPAAP